MRDLSLHLLDLLDNCIAASSTRVQVRLREDRARDLLSMEIADDGEGMDEARLRLALDPFYTTRKGKRVGLGLALLAQAAREAGGEVSVSSRPGGGTRVRASFRLSHPDRKPLGDLDGTIRAVRATHPEITLEYSYALVGECEGGANEAQA
jgi:signal transduction histidine kinase